jgi:hypothetical protein
MNITMNLQNLVGVILSLLVILFEVLTAFSNKKNWLLSIPIIMWMAHGIIFFIFAHCINDKVFVNSWSQILRLHGILTFLSLSWYRYVKSMKNGGNTT